MNDKYWENFYKNNEVTSRPSSFAKFCIKFIPKNYKLYDIGCGNLRDTNYLIKNSVKAIPIDKIYGKTFKDIKTSKKSAYYSRFFIHAIEEKEIIEFINMIDVGLFMAEFRVIGDKPILYKKHKRTLINPQWLLNEFVLKGFNVKYFIVDRDLAVYKKENPLICRIICQK
jgi:hypothetical protein